MAAKTLGRHPVSRTPSPPSWRQLSVRRRGWHRSGGFRADVQLALAGAIIGLLLKRPAAA